MDPVTAKLPWDDGPWTDQAHLPAKDVEQLRQLIQAGLAQERPEPRDTWVVFDLEGRLELPAQACVSLETLLCIHDHGAKLIAPELPATLSDPAVFEEN